MKKAAVMAAFCTMVFFGSTVQAHAGTSFSFGLTVGPSVPYAYGYYPAPYGYGYYPAPPPYYYQGYAYPVYSTPVIRTVVVPRYYSVGGYRYNDIYYKGHKVKKSNPRSKSGRWRY